MKSKLSPQGRKLAMAAGSEPVRASVEAVGEKARAALAEALPRLGARALSSPEASGLMTVEIAADRLEELAGVPGIGYVDVGRTMAPGEDGDADGGPFLRESVMPTRKPGRVDRDRAAASGPEGHRDARSPSPDRSPGRPPRDGRSPREGC